MRRVFISTFLVIALFTLEASLLSFPVGCESVGTYVYTYVVHKSGWIDIKTEFRANGRGTSWVLVPKYDRYCLRIKSGKVLWKKIDVAKTRTGETFYFYDNLSFEYEGGLDLVINWSYRFGALIVEPNGAFYTTQVGFDGKDRAVVQIVFPKDFEIKSVEPGRYLRKDNSTGTYIFFENLTGSNNFFRSLVSFHVRNQGTFLQRNVKGLTIIYPKRYEDVVDNLSSVYLRGIGHLMNITGFKRPINVTVKFFVPESVKELEAFGYTNLKGSSDVLERGVVYLNMIIVRTPTYEMPEVLFHELAHQYMWHSGLMPHLRWAHEGLADYISIYICHKLGFKEAGLYEYRSVSLLVNKTGGKVGFVQKWSSGGLPPNADLYYAASLYVISELAKKHGGMMLYKKLFEIARRRNISISNFSEFLSLLNKAAGTDLSKDFREMGFEVPKLREEEPLELRYMLCVSELLGMFNPFNPHARSYLSEAKNLFEVGDTTRGRIFLYKGAIIIALGFMIEFSLIALTASLVIFLRERKGPRKKGGIVGIRDLQYNAISHDTIKFLQLQELIPFLDYFLF